MARLASLFREGTSMTLHRPRNREGVSLVELLLVITIMAVALGLIVPVVMQARREAARTKTIENLRAIAAATLEAHNTYKKYPPYWGSYPSPPGGVWWCVGEPEERSLYFHLLPFLNGKKIHDAAPQVTPAFEAYLSPLDPTTSDGTNGKEGVTSLLANQAAFCSIPTAPKPSTYTWLHGSFRSGLSNCVFFATAVSVPSDPAAHIWTGPTAWFADSKGSRLPRPLPILLENAAPQQPYQLTPQGSLLAMGDTSTRGPTPYMFVGNWASACDPTFVIPLEDD
jgi:type II secretory pathway pseudopilin PulG